MTADQGRRLFAAAARVPAGRADRRDRQLPRPLDDRAGRRPRPTASRSSPSTRTPATTAARRRSTGSPPRPPTDHDVFDANLARGRRRRSGASRRARSPTDAHGEVDGPDRRALHRRRPPLRPGARRHPRVGRPGHADGGDAADPRLVLVDRRDRWRSCASSCVGRRFRYVGRSRSLVEYRADLRGSGVGAGAQRRPPARPARRGSPATSASRCCSRSGSAGWPTRLGPPGPGVAVLTRQVLVRRCERPGSVDPATGWGRTAPSAATVVERSGATSSGSPRRSRPSARGAHRPRPRPLLRRRGAERRRHRDLRSQRPRPRGRRSTTTAGDGHRRRPASASTSCCG